MRRLLLLVAFFLVACEAGPPLPAVTVLATGEDGGPLADLLDEFTDDTGIPVAIQWGNSSANADRVIENSGAPADVLITDNVADIWRAADRGALRPIQSTAITAVHAAVKDPDSYWTAISTHLHIVVHGNDVRPLTATYDDLGTAEFAGRICLSSSSLPANRALIAYLIDERGVREAERLVRRWVRNLAQPPFSSKDEVLDAVRSGTCDYGVGVMSNDLEGLTSFTPAPHYFDVSAAGIGRHARQPESAQKLLDWLLRNSAVQFETQHEPAPVWIAGSRDEDARLLAERAGYR